MLTNLSQKENAYLLEFRRNNYITDARLHKHFTGMTNEIVKTLQALTKKGYLSREFSGWCIL